MKHVHALVKENKLPRKHVKFARNWMAADGRDLTYHSLSDMFTITNSTIPILPQTMEEFKRVNDWPAYWLPYNWRERITVVYD